MRVKEAIALVGTQMDAAQLSGVAYGTITNYVDGGEMKLSNAAALARATGVRLEWLATGEGPMRTAAGGDDAARPAATPRSAEMSGFAEPGVRGETGPGNVGIAWQVNPERLARAYEMASAKITGASVTPTLVMRVALVIYDHLTEAEGTKPSSPAPSQGA